MERTELFLLLHTGEGAHSKQEFPNNRFVNMVITVCSSTAGGSPWVEQAGPRDGRRREGAKTEQSSLSKGVRQGKRPSSPEKGGQDRADVVKCVRLCI